MNTISYKTILSLSVLLPISLFLSAAAVLNPLTMPTATIASYTVSTTNLETVTATDLAYAYRPWFENGAWQGDIIQYDMLKNSSISTTVNLTTTVPTNATNANGVKNWSARLQFDAKTLSYYDTVRKVITSSGNSTTPTQIAFRWNVLSGTATGQQNSLDPNAFTNGLTSSTILDFVRGDRSNEVNGTPAANRTLRQRYNILGDIIHNDPVYVGVPNSKIFDTGYSTFKTTNATRAPRVYAGANDGMLHVFNALTGDEVYAYIPSKLIGKLNLLSKVPYVHQYYVDGSLAAGDMVFTDGQWGSILVGTYGAGGKGLFALDITDPDLLNETNNLAANKKVLWELDERDQATGGIGDVIGNIYDKSEIVKFSDGNWYVTNGNGYGSTNGSASLLLIDSAGDVTVIDAEVASGVNGLSRPTLIDKNGDGAVDYAYAGDLLGNMYRFNLTDLNTITVETLFSAGINKPITTAPKVASHPLGGQIVLFATGSILSQADVLDTSIQSIYGIRDIDNATTLTTVTAAELFTQILSADVAFDANKSIRYIVKQTTAPTTIDWSVDKGWVVDLPAGERVSLDPNLRAGRFQVMSVNPVSQEAWLIQLDFYDGAASKIFYNLFDTDQFFDALDTVNIPVDGLGNQTGIGDIPVALKQGVGSFSRQLILRVVNGVDANYINGVSLPPGEVTCVTGCENGFARGHIDVDTDTPIGSQATTLAEDSYCYTNNDRTLAPVAINGSNYVRSITSKSADGYSGATDEGHQHEYDKAHGTVDVNYINLEGYCQQNRPATPALKPNTGEKLSRATEAGIGNATQFFAIVANADLSPGSTFNLGEQSWNVVEYQRLIEERLDLWNQGIVKDATTFATIMVDANGNSLIHTIDDIKASMTAGTGKLSNSFNDRAIIEGGLHPTQSGCVRDQLTISNGRWRNGALTTQLIEVSAYITDPTTVVSQTPTDLISPVTFNGITTTLKVGSKWYGGLIANNRGSITGVGQSPTGANFNSAFLYESALFWHFGDLLALLGQSEPCYGDAGYDQAKLTELTGLTQAQFDALLNDPNSSLYQDYQALQAAIANNASAADIAKLQDNIDSIRDYVVNPTNPGAPVSQPVNNGEPSLTADKTATDGFVLGPNSTTGRRTWIDIR